MNEADLEKARDIYVDNLGSSFYMVRNGVYREYKAYDVPAELEAQWRSELVSHISASMSGGDLGIVANLVLIASYDNSTVIIESILDFILNQLHTLDSYAVMVYADHLWNMSSRADNELASGPYRQARVIAVRMWHNVLNGPIALNPDRLLEGLEEGGSPEEFLRVWARKRLAEAEPGD